MATPIRVEIKKKPDDWVLRASMGGDDGMGYYLVYRGNLRYISSMLTIVHERVRNMIRQGIEAPMEKEDEKHTSPGVIQVNKIIDDLVKEWREAPVTIPMEVLLRKAILQATGIV
jgi:hypothetical protein